MDKKIRSRIYDLGVLPTRGNKGGNVDKLFNAFYDKVTKLINKHAPVKPISKRMIKRSSKPWITKGIRRSINIKSKLFY
jgi:hypothetical protein